MTGRTLSADVDILGRCLGAVIRDQEGNEFFALEERVRLGAKRRRERDDDGSNLQAELARVAPADAQRLVRAFSCYFLLVNIAEEFERVRRVHATAGPHKQGFEQAFRELAGEGHTAATARDLVFSIDLGLTFTAHPTEMRRRTVRGHLDAIAALVPDLDRPEAQERITAHVEALWSTPRLRDRKPEVRDEVNAGLAYVDVIGRVLPGLERDLEASYARVFGERARLSLPLSLHSWMGGDRDGNPNVTAEVTSETFAYHGKLARTGLARVLVESFGWLSHGRHVPGSEALDEPFRRLVQTAYDATVSTPEDQADAQANETTLADALRALDRELDERKQERSRDWFGRELFVRHRVFGLHFASLDIREHSRVTGRAVAELLQHAGIGDYESSDEESRVRVLTKELSTRRPLMPVGAAESPELARVLDPMRAAKVAMTRAGRRAFGSYIVSMSESVSDLLEVLVLAREVGLALLPVPLFETLDDLTRAPDIIERALAIPAYRTAAAGTVQEVMIGYSDSNKDAGFFAASWALYVAQEEIARVCREAGVRHRFFHGRGTSIGRGGGPMARALVGQPPGTVGEGIRITEQGEALSDKYSHPELAYRNLEQGLYGLLLAAGRRARPLDPTWKRTLDAAARESSRVYRSLVHGPDFIDFFEAVTPIREIAKLRIASRPIRRPGSTDLANLRAIPWVMAWTQCRANIPGWYGLGPALATIASEDDLLPSRMYETWPFFRSMIDNAQMALAKSDLDVFRAYRSLSKDTLIGDALERAFAETVAAVERVTGARLLHNEPRLLKSIELRNPYIEPMHRLQVELLRKARSFGGEELPAELERALVLSLHGIASGMRNTG